MLHFLNAEVFQPEYVTFCRAWWPSWLDVEQLSGAGSILDWDTLIHTDKFYQAKTTSLVTLPLAPGHSSGQHLPYILY